MHGLPNPTHQTDWDQLEQTAQSFLDSRWPYIGEGLLALLPLLKANQYINPALVYTSMGTLILEFPPDYELPKFHIEVLEPDRIKLYWYGSNPLDYESDHNIVGPIREVFEQLLWQIMG